MRSAAPQVPARSLGRLPAPAWLLRIIATDGQLPTAPTSGRHVPLVRRAVDGDPQAFEELIRDAGPRLLATARKILRDPDAAEDALQQAVILAWRKLPRLREPERFDAWLYKILVSCCYAEGRRARRFAAKVQAVSLEPEGASADDLDRWLDRESIEQAFRSLTPAHRAVVVLHHYAGLPLVEVAAIVGISPGTARSRLHYALRALRAALQASDRPVVMEVRP